MRKKVPKVLIVGDSISMGYAPLVREILDGAFIVEEIPEKVWPRNSKSLLSYVDEWMIKPGYDIIHANCGLHDLAIVLKTQEHSVPLKQYETNVEEVIRRLKNETSALIVWATTTPIIDEWFVRPSPVGYGGLGIERHERDVKAYNEAATRVMLKHDVPIDDLHKVVVDAGVEKCIGQDGCHMNATGNAFLSKAVANFLQTLWKKQKKSRAC